MRYSRICFLLIGFLLFSCGKNKEDVLKPFANGYYLLEEDLFVESLSEDFVVFIDDQQIESGTAFVISEVETNKRVETKFKAIEYLNTGGESIGVSYTSSNWVYDCFGIKEVKNLDTYHFRDSKIFKLEKASFESNKIDSIFNLEQDYYYSWLYDNGFDTIVIKKNGVNQDKYFEFLKEYCLRKEIE